MANKCDLENQLALAQAEVLKLGHDLMAIKRHHNGDDRAEMYALRSEIVDLKKGVVRDQEIQRLKRIISRLMAQVMGKKEKLSKEQERRVTLQVVSYWRQKLDVIQQSFTKRSKK